jgi:hypothetical protein
MTRTMSDAHVSILCRSLARALLGLPSRIRQCDCVLCEDNKTVQAWAYFGDDPDCDVHVASWDLETPIAEEQFDAEATRRELLRLDDFTYRRDARRIAAMLREAAM